MAEPVRDLVLVTGPSGAGRSTAIRALEDQGFEAIDNLPLSFLMRLLDGPPLVRPLAVGVDARTRDFSADALIEAADAVSRDGRVRGTLLFLDARTDVLIRRFSETRRPHPLAPAETPMAGISRDRDLLAPVRDRADTLIDTSDLSPHELRAEIVRLFDATGSDRLAVSIHSFSFKRGVPRGVDMVFDVRFLRNPYWVPELRALDGRDVAVSHHVAGDPNFAPFLDRLLDMLLFLLPAYVAEGKAYLAIGIGCTGGRHRSVATAERVVQRLEAAGWPCGLRHREMESAPALGATG